jgi:hypothetical protein
MSAGVAMKAAALLLGMLALASAATAAEVKRGGASRRMLGKRLLCLIHSNLRKLMHIHGIGD